MGLYAICTGYQKDNFRGSKNKAAQSKIESNGNNYAAMNCFAPGIEINPADGEFLVINRIKDSDSFMVTIGGVNQNIAPTTDRGERLIYSVSADGKTKKASALFKNDGTLELNGNSKKLVTHAELNTAIQTFITALNLHVHTSAAAGSPTTPPVTSLSMDISSSATTTLKTGG